jgi:hypothetical protein
MSIPDEADESGSAETVVVEGITYYAVTDQAMACRTKDGQRCSAYSLRACYDITRCEKDNVLYIPREEFLIMRLKGLV